jgi:predicted nucleotide-binding protein (sugar kinase/HSP70/actin superfamily)
VKPVVGIPRALLYWQYFPLWQSFLEGIGVETYLSPPTGRQILQDGLAALGTDVCLPVKVAAGHLLALRDRVDLILLPRLVSAARREYACPKLMGLPDLVRHSLSLPPLLSPVIDRYRHDNWPLIRVALAVGRRVGAGLPAVLRSLARAVECYRRYLNLLQAGYFPQEAWEAAGAGQAPDPRAPAGDVVALIGHPYTVYDREINLNLLGRLERAGLSVRTAEQVPEATARRAAAALPKHLFWTAGQQAVGAAFHYLEQEGVVGMISVMSFGCGPDSMTGDLIARRARRGGIIPHLSLTLDEHAAEAGVLTRLEAFLDMVAAQRERGVVVCG